MEILYKNCRLNHAEGQNLKASTTQEAHRVSYHVSLLNQTPAAYQKLIAIFQTEGGNLSTGLQKDDFIGARYGDKHPLFNIDNDYEIYHIIDTVGYMLFRTSLCPYFIYSIIDLLFTFDIHYS
jgi:hypothetical protein